MLDKMKQLMEMKRKAEQLKKELDATTIEVTEIQGIKIIINGSQNFQSIDIDDSLLSLEDKNKVKGELLRSVNTAIKKSQFLATEKMKAMTGLYIPGQ